MRESLPTGVLVCVTRNLGKVRVPGYLSDRISLFFPCFDLTKIVSEHAAVKVSISSHKKIHPHITMRPAVPSTLRGAQQRIVRSKWAAPRAAGQSIQSLNLSLGLRSGISLNTAASRLGSRGLSYTARLRDQEGNQQKSLLEDTRDEREWSTPLAKQLAEAISMTGPIPLASFMRMCLTADVGGYYTGALEEGRDQFGVKGDFVTSPEISQVFGELIGLWFLTEWLAQGKQKQGVELIEVGPGRGTLMDDMLRTIQNFPAMANSIDAIYMVEASPELRLAQKNLLCGEDAPMTESKVGYHSICKYTSLPIVWTETIKSIPISPDKMPFIIAHEFFDALPIHAFECVNVPATNNKSTTTPSSSSTTETLSSPSTQTSSSTLQWRELVVTPTPPGSTHESLHTPLTQSRNTPSPDFQLTRADQPTRHSLYLPESSPRYRSIKNKVGPGALLEICPDASLYASDFAARIGGSAQHPKSKPSGAALILDYGPGDGTVPMNSLRGIRLHERVSPFALPGQTDLSADVDFAAIAEAATRASEGVEVHGPVEQGAFLYLMGIEPRVNMLIKAAWRKLKVNANNAKNKAAAEARKGVVKDWTAEAEKMRGETEEYVELVRKAMERLVDRGPNGMGKIYKALAILPENNGRRRPVGFGGNVVGVYG